MTELFVFFDWFFPAMWGFFKIPFPLLNMTVGQVLVGASLVSFSFTLLGILLHVSFGKQLSISSISNRNQNKPSGSPSYYSSSYSGEVTYK